MFPEHEKLKAVQEQSQAIGGFIEWLENEKLVPFFYGSINRLLAEFFEIDLERLEDEKLSMLSQLQNSPDGAGDETCK